MSKPKAFPKEALPLLGKLQDKQLAAALGISARSVYRERKNRGVERPRRSSNLSPSQQELLARLKGRALKVHREQKLGTLPAKAASLLGVVPDRDLAHALGTKQLLVSRERGFRGIPAIGTGSKISPAHTKTLIALRQKTRQKMASDLAAG